MDRGGTRAGTARVLSMETRVPREVDALVRARAEEKPPIGGPAHPGAATEGGWAPGLDPGAGPCPSQAERMSSRPSASDVSAISLGRVTAALVLGRLAGYALGLVNSVVLVRALGVERLGAYAYAMGVTALFGLLPNLGISTVVTRSIARDPADRTGIVRAAARAQGLLAAGVLMLIPAFAWILPGQPVPLGFVALAAAQFAVGTLSWPHLAVLAGRARYDRVAAVDLTAAFIGTGSIVVAAAFQGGVVAFLCAHVLAAGISVLVARRIARPFRSMGPSAGRSASLRLGALLRQAAPLGATAAVQSLYTRLDILMLGQMASTAALGLYSAAYRPTNLAVYLGNTVGGTLLPLMAQEPPRGTPVAFVRAMRGLGAAAPAMALAFAGLATPALTLLFGAPFAAGGPILAILAFSAACNWLYAPLAISLQARGQERWWLGSLIGGTLLNAVANFWAIPRWGGIGAAWATLASEGALLVLATVLVAQRLTIRPPLRPILLGLGAAAAGGAALAMLRGRGPVLATGVALGVYAGFAALFRLVTVEDVTLVVGWVRQAASGGIRR